jgi:hypothetical protein
LYFSHDGKVPKDRGKTNDFTHLNFNFLLLLFLLPAQKKEAKKRAFAILRKFRLQRTTAAVNTGAQAIPSFPSPLFLRIALSSPLQCQWPGDWNLSKSP